MLYLAEARRLMVDRQMRRRDIADPRVLDAAGRVERDRFLPPELAEYTYDDAPLPIGEGQTMSQPYMVALMAQAADLRPGSRVLEIGTGSGYAAALMSLLCARVFSIERHPALAVRAGRHLTEGGYGGVEVRIGDGTLGWPEAAPFDAIVVTAGWSFRSANATTSACSGSHARPRTRTARRTSAACSSCRSWAARAGVRVMAPETPA